MGRVEGAPAVVGRVVDEDVVVGLALFGRGFGRVVVEGRDGVAAGAPLGRARGRRERRARGAQRGRRLLRQARRRRRGKRAGRARRGPVVVVGGAGLAPF